MAQENTLRHAILIVDDETSVLRALRRVLKDEDYDVFTASNHVEVMELLEKHTFAVIVADYGMPEMLGDELLGIVRTRSPRTARIMLSGTALTTSVPRPVADGILNCQIFIAKPWNDENLRGTIKKCVREYEVASKLSATSR